MKTLLKAIVVVILLIGIAIVGTLFYYNSMISPVDETSTEGLIVEIPQGSSLRKASSILHSNNLIKNERVFLLYAKLNEKESIKAGRYSISKSNSTHEILDILNKGAIAIDNKITIPEGYEVRNIAQTLEAAGILSADEFIETANNVELFKKDYNFLSSESILSLEGYLFPDTYYINNDMDSEDIIRLMLNRFENIYKSNQVEDRLLEKNITLNEFITMASIVEREAVLQEERPVIAGVFYKRLSINMPLQSCATVQYIIKERKPILSIADTKIESPYNTYINSGLPPAPIASPGLNSMLATLEPEETDFIFFVARGDGGHEFSKTYDEHLKAKKKYLGE
ncbi:UPF0755 protein [Acetoanaerobium pronyense]|uniref:Endolytic murein transglycosylase n=1 Tax=Acetoanaerobium pronyense TaxID=1482736 RepID=A0ABS4KLV9_9FIRM|nr:endolytic transglycosylase MltG [Acetoanaerobium pronyense]MBP2027604.1 UPF0755 protein [Acetoanaerobium pronyense]